MFVTDNIWQIMVDETKTFAQQVLESTTPKSKLWFKDLAETNAQGMKAFVGVLICISLICLPILSHYRAESNMYGMELIRQNMSRDHFSCIPGSGILLTMNCLQSRRIVSSRSDL